MGTFYVDYRFIVQAKDRTEAAEKVEKIVRDGTNDISYTIASITKKPER